MLDRIETRLDTDDGESRRTLAERLVEHFAPRAGSIPIHDLSPGRCAWPLGEVGDDGFGYCGEATAL